MLISNENSPGQGKPEKKNSTARLLFLFCVCLSVQAARGEGPCSPHHRQVQYSCHSSLVHSKQIDSVDSAAVHRPPKGVHAAAAVFTLAEPTTVTGRNRIEQIDPPDAAASVLPRTAQRLKRAVEWMSDATAHFQRAWPLAPKQGTRSLTGDRWITNST